MPLKVRSDVVPALLRGLCRTYAYIRLSFRPYAPPQQPGSPGPVNTPATIRNHASSPVTARPMIIRWIDAMARLGHPDAEAVLTMLGRHCDNKKTAKAARKAAFKTASHRASRRN
jgi:hypothetical protein